MLVRHALAAATLWVAAAGCQNAGHQHAGHHGYHEHPFAQMPGPVQDAVRRDYPNAEVVSAGHEWYDKDGTPHYHVRLKSAGGGVNSVEYDAAGKRLAD